MAHIFPVGARVLIDGRDQAIVRGAFPEGSSSYLFPHYKVDFVGGDRNVAVEATRVGVKTGRRSATKRSSSSRSKPKRHAKKRRTLTRLRARVATKRHGYGVMKSSHRLSKKELLLAGYKIVASDADMDAFEGDEDLYRYLASVPNPKQVGTKDRWLAYLK